MEEAQVIDFSSPQIDLLLNPRMPAPERQRLERLAASSPLRSHVIVATSGSSGAVKLVALSKDALLASAAAVIQRLEAKSSDVWCCVLPTFHVGGLGVHARAFLTRSPVISLPWDPRAFASSEATLASLVPAQLRDLITLGLQPSRKLRAILVGGGAIDRQLDARAQALGWPLLASYGLTECCSTVAVRDVLLSHLEGRVESDGRLAFRGASLLSGYIAEEGFVDPKVDGWFISEDVGEVDGRVVRVHGRRDDFVKIGGESVNLSRLDRVIEEVRGKIDAAIVAVPDERLGFVIHLATTADDAREIVDAFNAKALPFERIRAVHRVASIPRSSLGKLLRRELTARLRS